MSVSMHLERPQASDLFNKTYYPEGERVGLQVAIINGGVHSLSTPVELLFCASDPYFRVTVVLLL